MAYGVGMEFEWDEANAREVADYEHNARQD